MDFASLMTVASNAMNYIDEGKRLYDELVVNYANVRATLSATEQTTLDAKLAELQAKSAEVHADIQNQT